MEREVFLDEQNWGEYHCWYAIEFLDPHGLDTPDIARALWRYPALYGPWRERSSYPGPTTEEFDLSLYGLITIDGYEPTGCYTLDMMEMYPTISLEIPLRMLQRVVPVNVQFDNHGLLDVRLNPWMPVFDTFFINIAEYIFRQFPFYLAIICAAPEGLGYSNDGERTFAEMNVEEGGLLLSQQLWELLHPTVDAVLMPSGLRWIPRKE